MADKVRLERAEVLESEPLEGKDARWLRLRKLTYRNPAGQTKSWESAERSTRPSSSAVDSVGVIALLKKPTGVELLLLRQFRPPTGKICIEIPSGLVDAGETPEEAAVRELHEETGYVGKIKPGPADFKVEGAKGIMYADPGLSNTNTMLVYVDVDMEKPENKHPKPQLEEGEFIETFTVPLNDFYMEVRKMEAQGYVIDGRVSTLAEGFEMGRMFFGGSSSSPSS